MIAENYLQFFLRDLTKVKEEFSLYKNENDLWILKGDVKNSTGTLALHLIGNLKHFIGAQLGNTGYVRQRDKEFSDRNVPKGRILSEIEETISMLKKILPTIKDSDLEKEYPIKFLEEKRTIGYILLTLSTHLNYHLGQINYHRRMIAG
ncbi:MAG: DinB family protein [Bacteroidetes bacterium]|nr:MAG: DinB family protein [Bacteroidota bacterium]